VVVVVPRAATCSASCRLAQPLVHLPQRLGDGLLDPRKLGLRFVQNGGAVVLHRLGGKRLERRLQPALGIGEQGPGGGEGLVLPAQLLRQPAPAQHQGGDGRGRDGGENDRNQRLHDGFVIRRGESCPGDTL
jgi:hypothetical protein